MGAVSGSSACAADGSSADARGVTIGSATVGAPTCGAPAAPPRRRLRRRPARRTSPCRWCPAASSPRRPSRSPRRSSPSWPRPATPHRRCRRVLNGLAHRCRQRRRDRVSCTASMPGSAAGPVGRSSATAPTWVVTGPVTTSSGCRRDQWRRHLAAWPPAPVRRRAAWLPPPAGAPARRRSAPFRTWGGGVEERSCGLHGRDDAVQGLYHGVATGATMGPRGRRRLYDGGPPAAAGRPPPRPERSPRRTEGSPARGPQDGSDDGPGISAASSTVWVTAGGGRHHVGTTGPAPPPAGRAERRRAHSG